MPKQLQWAIGGLALLIIGFVALQIYLHVDMKQFKEELADPEPKTETETEQPPDQVQVPEVDIRPPQPDDGRKYEWHGDHWHEVLELENESSIDAEQSVPLVQIGWEYHTTRQGTRYLKDPGWSDHSEANITPKGNPLIIDWGRMPEIIGMVDWFDPLTWESYRNFWGFDFPYIGENGVHPYRAVVDNHGTPLQMFRNVALVTNYTTRTGFRPTPEQLEQYNELQDLYKGALILGDSSTAEAQKQKIDTLVSSAQGEIPNPYSYFIEFYGDPVGPGPDPPEVRSKRQADAIKNLYKRLEIPHLYELYELE